jgi:hypothetical protein
MNRHQHKRTDKQLRRVATLSKGKIARRIIAKLVDGGKEYTLHATKGYRATRV